MGGMGMRAGGGWCADRAVSGFGGFASGRCAGAGGRRAWGRECVDWEEQAAVLGGAEAVAVCGGEGSSPEH